MGRSLRIHCPGLIYHVINRGNNRQAIFLEDEDYERYLSVVYRFKKVHGFKLYAFCLMTNHVHLLIRVGDKSSISKIMQSITLAHTKHYHHKYKTSGHVWQGRFKSPIVSNDEYMLEAMAYIEKNPVKAKMVKRPEDYRWSSYLLNIRKQDGKLIDRSVNESYDRLGNNVSERIKAYKEFMKMSLSKDKQKMLEKSMKGEGHYMSEKFAEQIAGMIPKKRPRGRPRKQRELILK